MQFDLISDLHIETWPEDKQLEWSGMPTSLVAVIAGDISKDLDITYKTVLEISKHYRHTIFVDGNHEHGFPGNDIHTRRLNISEKFSKYKNISYLFRNTIILDNVAFVGCNGWWSYDFCEPYVSKQDAIQYQIDKGSDEGSALEQWNTAIEDSEHISHSVDNCNRNPEIKSIVVVTHTVPNKKLSWMPDQTHLVPVMGTQGSSYLESIPLRDVNKKIKVWCFGHVHHPQDTVIDDIRYVSNPRGIPGHLGSQEIYFPKFIKC